ncbi:MAG: amidohydrolase family protein [Chloroflexi bacterium]|uniref:amidohydrolase family protein n=1 Tax=Candidatus Flexifilum breve TaxID=3140694 RepID=UPI003135BD8F|nr:amidohydrolase family protein [Chloroflexota bacterium]
MAAAAETGVIDAHVHIWDRSRFHYHWLAPGSPLDHDVSLEDIRAEMLARNVQGGILMEATNTAAEIAWLLDTADADSLNWGVIGWLNLEHPHSILQIDQFSQHPRFKGVRLNCLTPRPEPESLYPTLRALAARGLVVEVLAEPDQLGTVAELARRFPNLTFVLNHFGGWTLNQTSISAWCAALQPLAVLPNVTLKLSGYAASDLATLRAYTYAAAALFGGQRLIFGSNTPFCPHGYSAAIHLLMAACADQSEAWRGAVLRDNARALYRLFPNGVSV